MRKQKTKNGKQETGLISCFLFSVFCLLLAVSCREEAPATQNLETLVTQRSDTLTLLNYQDGAKSYRFYTPLMERHEFAREPYQEFPRGIEMRNFKQDTILTSSLRSDYAIFYERLELWEVKGNVVGTNEEGMIMETQQLFWDQRAKRIYSNVDTKVTQPSGDVIVGQGFESDEAFNNLVYRRPHGQITIDTEPRADTTAVDSTVVETPPVVVDEAAPHAPIRRLERREREEMVPLLRVEE